MFGPEPAEREEMARLLPVPAERDLPGNRRRLLKDCLMNEIQPAPAPANTLRPNRRRRLALVAVPLAAAAVFGVVTARAAGHSGTSGRADAQAAPHTATDAAPSTAASPAKDEPIEITNAAYTLKRTGSGEVDLSISDGTGRLLDLPTLQRDLNRMGVPALVYAGTKDCAYVPRADRDDDAPWKTVSLRLDKAHKPYVAIRPDRLKPGEHLLIDFGYALTDPKNAAYGMTAGPHSGPAPACMPAMPGHFGRV
jgi:hypothetical protein